MLERSDELGTAVSQKHVEWLLGRLATNSEFRQRFYAEPVMTCLEECMELTSRELEAVLNLNEQRLEEFAKHLDPRVVRATVSRQKSHIGRQTSDRFARLRTPQPSVPQLRKTSGSGSSRGSS